MFRRKDFAESLNNLGNFSNPEQQKFNFEEP